MSFTFGDWLDERLTMTERQGARATTPRGYRWLVREHIKPTLGSKRLGKLTPGIRANCSGCTGPISTSKPDAYRPAGVQRVNWRLLLVEAKRALSAGQFRCPLTL